MKITFFGSSHGVPEPGRKCACLLLELGEVRYFIDMGTPPVDGLVVRGIPVESVRAVFISHMHGDHTNGLFPFCDLINWYYKKADPTVYLPSEGADEILRSWLISSADKDRGIRFDRVREGVFYDDGLLRVSAILTRHSRRNSYAFLFEAEGKRFLYTGDLSAPPADFPVAALAEPVDLMICESAHFPSTEYLPYLEGKDVKKIVVTHYTTARIPAFLEFKKAMGDVPVSLANDNMEILL